MGGAPTFAGNLALFFGRHRSKTTSFFPQCVHRHPPRGETLFTTTAARAHDAVRVAYKRDATATKMCTALTIESTAT
jgi:hypothetical protein